MAAAAVQVRVALVAREKRKARERLSQLSAPPPPARCPRRAGRSTDAPVRRRSWRVAACPGLCLTELQVNNGLGVAANVGILAGTRLLAFAFVWTMAAWQPALVLLRVVHHPVICSGVI